jgi:hypothetical protein
VLRPALVVPSHMLRTRVPLNTGWYNSKKQGRGTLSCESKGKEGRYFIYCRVWVLGSIGPNACPNAAMRMGFWFWLSAPRVLRQGKGFYQGSTGADKQGARAPTYPEPLPRHLFSPLGLPGAKTPLPKQTHYRANSSSPVGSQEPKHHSPSPSCFPTTGPSF